MARDRVITELKLYHRNKNNKNTNKTRRIKWYEIKFDQILMGGFLLFLVFLHCSPPTQNKTVRQNSVYLYLPHQKTKIGLLLFLR